MWIEFVVNVGGAVVRRSTRCWTVGGVYQLTCIQAEGLN
jgi:hypothetical protein